MDDEGSQIGFIADLVKLAPDMKIVVLAGPNSDLDQPASLKLGRSGNCGCQPKFTCIDQSYPASV